MTPELERTLLVGVEALQAVGSRYAIVGGLAVSTWALPRATRDVDLYAELPSSTRRELERELIARGFEVPAMEEELQRFGVFRSRSVRDGVFLDIFDAVGPLGNAVLDRRREISIEGRALWLIAPDDLVVIKAFSDRSRDFDDLVVLFQRIGSTLDIAYVEHWAAVLDESIGSDEVGERLRKARELATGR